jgi:hypothetical protein
MGEACQLLPTFQGAVFLERYVSGKVILSLVVPTFDRICSTVGFALLGTQLPAWSTLVHRLDSVRLTEFQAIPGSPVPDAHLLVPMVLMN